MSKCEHCGFTVEHAGICPSIKAIEYYETGVVKRVEYKCAVDYHPVGIQPALYGVPPTSFPLTMVVDH